MFRNTQYTYIYFVGEVRENFKLFNKINNSSKVRRSKFYVGDIYIYTYTYTFFLLQKFTLKYIYTVTVNTKTPCI